MKYWWLGGLAGLIIIVAIIFTRGGGPVVKQTDTQTMPIVKQTKTMILETSLGVITVELWPALAPKTVENFITLAERGFYDGTFFHRVIPNFMIQGGDPLTREFPEDRARHGTGGPGYTFPDEINEMKLVRGVLAMANGGPNTNGSQFFIITAPATDWLDGKHTAFGRVTEGLDVVDAISRVKTDSRDHPVEEVILQKVIIR